MVKPIGSFEWGAVLLGSAVVTTIVVLYAIGWGRAAGETFVPLRADVKAATSVAPTPAREAPPPVRDPVPKATYALAANRGDSWLLVRAGSFRARSLFEGVLPQGETVRLRAPRLWIRFGAASHVDLTIDGKRVPLPAFGTFDAFAGPRGVVADRQPYATAAQSP